MGEHFRISSWLCKLCYLSIREERHVLLAIEHRTQCHATTRDPCGCPRQFCPECKEASSAFPYHPFCVDVFLDAISSLRKNDTVIETAHSQANEALCKLGQALAFNLPVHEPSEPSLSFPILEQSFCLDVLGRISERCKREKCPCIACLFRQLSRLPTELLTGHILPYITQSYVRQTVPIYGEILKVFSLLKKHPAGDHILSYTTKPTRFCFGKGSYITVPDQSFPGPQVITSRQGKPKYIVVWLDKMGVTDVRFLDSKTITDGNQRKHERVYAFAFTDTIYVRSKGVFLERMAGSTSNNRRILWNSIQSPFFFEEMPFDRMPTQCNEYLINYVPMDNISAISVAFRSGAMIAIVSHYMGTKYELPAYTETEYPVIWTHFPLDEDEEILEIWSVSYKLINQGIRSLVLKTQRKLLWLGHYIPPTIWSFLQVTCIASSPVSALYYSELSPAYSQILQPRSTKQVEDLAPPAFPTYQMPPPMFRYRTDICDQFYSEAGLDGVVQVQLCLDKGYCIGLLLRYKSYSRTVGVFRYDKEVSEYFHQPRSVALIQHDSSVCIKFSEDIVSPNGTGDNEWQPMTGLIVWWLARNMSVVSILGTAI